MKTPDLWSRRRRSRTRPRRGAPHRRTRRRGEHGGSAVEYGLLISGIAALAVAAVFLFGHAAADMFGKSCQDVAALAKPGAC